MPGLVNDAHAAAADFANDFEIAKDAHRRRCRADGGRGSQGGGDSGHLILFAEVGGQIGGQVRVGAQEGAAVGRPAGLDGVQVFRQDGVQAFVVGDLAREHDLALARLRQHFTQRVHAAVQQPDDGGLAAPERRRDLRQGLTFQLP